MILSILPQKKTILENYRKAKAVYSFTFQKINLKQFLVFLKRQIFSNFVNYGS